jgi:hypothetical protein
MTMALIDGPLLDIPEDDGWRDDVAARVLFVIFGAVLLRLGLRLWAVVEPEGLIAAIPTFLCYAGGVQLLVLAASDVDFHAHGRTIAYLTAALLTLVTFAVSWQTGFPVRLGTDALAFTSYSVELVAEGANPMAASMAPAADLPGAPDRWTYRVDGSRVESWSYPAGMFYAYLPQYLLIGRGPLGIRLTSVLGVLALAIVLIRSLPPVYAPTGVLALSIPRNQFLTAAGGLVDMWWLLPTVLALLAWYRERRLAAAVALGVACAMKQQPWAIPPFLAIWLWKERDSTRQFLRRGGRCAAVGLGTFAALNAPFFFADPAAWVDSVLVPLGGAGIPLEETGVGLAVLNQAGLGMPRSTFRIATATIIVLILAAYWRWFEQLRWAAWLAPPVILLWTPRSLPSYFNWAIPLALLAMVAVQGRLFDDARPEVYR